MSVDILSCAREWIAQKGWNVTDYHVAIADVQSCPAGFTSVDVTCLTANHQEEPSDLLKRSRVLEVNNANGIVETELAARDITLLKRMLSLEVVRVQTENMENILSEHRCRDISTLERDVTAEEILLEQDPATRLQELEMEIQRVKALQSEITSSTTRDVDAEAAWKDDALLRDAEGKLD